MALVVRTGMPMYPDAGVMPAKPATAPFMTATALGLWYSHASTIHTAPEQHAAMWVATTADTATLPAASALPPLKLHATSGKRHSRRGKNTYKVIF